MAEAENKPHIKLRSARATDVGMVRDHNEDSLYVDPDSRFFIVADGMGGHAAGEVASAMAVEQVRDALLAASDNLDEFAAGPTDEGRRSVVGVLENAVRAAHQAVFSRGASETDKQGMGTTLDVLLITGTEAFVAHVGDSRTYLLRDGKAAQVTTDHTVAEVLVIEGKLSVEEAQASPLRTILVNAIGVSADVGVEMSHVRLRTGDRLLLCSDGLHDYFPSEDEIASHLLGGEPDAGLTEMVELAKQRGGHDNITGIVVEVLECEAAPAPEPSDGEASDGVPRPMGHVDTMPVEASEVGDSVDPVGDTIPPAKGGKPKTTGKRGRETEPLGTDALDTEERATTPLPAVKPDGVETRKTEPMSTVAPPDGDDSDDDDD